MKHRYMRYYEGIHSGSQAIIYATGPSILKYSSKLEKPGAIHVGMKHVVCHPDIARKLHYYFCGDWNNRIRQYYKDLFTFYPLKAKFAYTQIGTKCGTGSPTCTKKSSQYWYMSPEFAQSLDMKEYTIAKKFGRWHKDIASNPFVHAGSTVFPALQFLLYTGVSQILLVGCDCTNKYSFAENGQPRKDDLATIWKRYWKEFAKFAEREYNNVEILWINPVGITDLFAQCSL